MPRSDALAPRAGAPSAFARVAPRVAAAAALTTPASTTPASVAAPVAGARGGRTWARRALAGVAWALVAALLAQVFTAGMAVFAHPGWWARHRAFVHAFEWLAPLALGLAMRARAPRGTVALAAGTVALLAAQYTTAHLRLASGAQGWAALHPVSAVLFVVLAVELARRASREAGR